MTRCPQAVYGEHGAANWRGRCPYCDQRLAGSRPRPPAERVPHEEWEAELDPVTLEPVDWCERDDVIYGCLRRRSFPR